MKTIEAYRMPVNILMPALSPTMEKGNLAKWLKKEGDKVKAGDVIAEIETDKATMEYEAIEDGVLAKIVVPEGTQDVQVNRLIAVLAQEGEDLKVAAAAAGKGAAPQPLQAQPIAASAEVRKNLVQEVLKEPALTAPAREEIRAEAPPRAGGHGSDRLFVSPLARRLARDAGLDLSQIKGSGPHGRVIARDIEQAKSGERPIAPSASRPPAIQLPSDDKIVALFEPGSYALVPHDNVRKIIARRLVEAKLTIPHFYLTVDCAVGKLLAAREEINAAAPNDADGKPAYKLSVNDFVIKALALALQRVPDANVTWTESAMLKHKHSDIGVAVAIAGGLITPIVRKAETKSLSVISNEMKDFAARARARKLKPEEYQGGSSALSNLGMYGIRDFAAVINPPHATILAVGSAEERPVARNGKIEAAMIMTATLSTDHRAVDGVLGAQLIGAFKVLIENPLMMIV
jgi:pyruvate dehydrogenase E2 component (dihydrolipoamide acetyltransferase)